MIPLLAKKGAEANAERAAAATPAETADEKLGEKLEEYLTGCLNNYARSRMRDDSDRYFRAVDEKKGPVLGKEPSLSKVDLADVEKCVAAVAKGKTMQPALPDLDAAVAAYADGIKAAAPQVNDAHKYYDQKDFRDDKLAKGQALHPQLVSHFHNFDKLSASMSAAFVKHKDPLDIRELDRLKAKGPAVVYVTKRSIMDAAKFSKAVDVSSVTEYFALPATDLQAKIDVLSQDHAELQKIIEAKGKELEGSFGVELYASSLEDFVKEAKEVTRRIRDKKTFTNSELERLGTSAGWMTHGSPDSLESKHKSLVGNYNRMRL
ncbi:MAG: DUF3829 domain-containing protein [Polyangiaceae bacterium]